MERIGIIIPTIKNVKDASLIAQASEMFLADSNIYIIYKTCKNVSASENRNYGLEKINIGLDFPCDYIIMVDDDITGFMSNWATQLVETLRDYPQMRILSARLMNKDGTYGTMRSFKKDIDNKLMVWPIPDAMCPSACIAFSRQTWEGVRDNKDLPNNKPFDENYKKACAEDSDFCKAVITTFPDSKVGVANRIQVVHLNEEKWRDKNETWKDNHLYFAKKWGHGC